jgi:putative DNA primase/helicase
MENTQGITFIRVLYGACKGMIEVRAFPSKQRWWISPGEPLLNFPVGQNIHLGVATRINGKGTKADLVEFPALWVDIDLDEDGFEGNVIHRLRGLPFKPSIRVNSGQGIHFYWLLDPPIPVSELSRVEWLNRQLATWLLGDTSSAEAARVLRLPGTLNFKYSPPRDVTLEYAYSEKRYRLEEFEAHFQSRIQGAPNQSQKTMVPKTGRGWFDEAMQGVDQGSRNSTAARLVGHYLLRRMGKEEIRLLLSDWNERNRPPLPEQELLAVLDSVVRINERESGIPKAVAQAEAPNDPAYLVGVIKESLLGLDDFLMLEIPARPFIMRPWLQPGTLALIYADKGIGKTWFSLSLAVAVTRQIPIGHWTTEGPVGCMYLDGEMPTDLLQARLRMLTVGLPEPKAPLAILSSDHLKGMEKPYPRISREEWRTALSDYLKNRLDIKLLIIDNIASLSPEIDENTKMAWDPINQWLLSLRAQGIAVILIHHTGKSGDHRGTSSRQDSIDTSFHLMRPAKYKPEDGAKFRVQFDKARTVFGEDAKSFNFQIVEEEENGRLVWKISEPERVSKELEREVVALIDEGGRPQKEIAEMAGCSPGRVSQIKKTAIDAGFLNAEGHLTDLGREYYELAAPEVEEDESDDEAEI